MIIQIIDICIISVVTDRGVTNPVHSVIAIKTKRANYAGQQQQKEGKVETNPIANRLASMVK